MTCKAHHSVYNAFLNFGPVVLHGDGANAVCPDAIFSPFHRSHAGKRFYGGFCHAKGRKARPPMAAYRELTLMMGINGFHCFVVFFFGGSNGVLRLLYGFGALGEVIQRVFVCRFVGGCVGMVFSLLCGLLHLLLQGRQPAVLVVQRGLGVFAFAGFGGICRVGFGV